MVENNEITSLENLATLCAKRYDSRFKKKVSSFRVCTLENGAPLRCIYRRGGWRNLEQEDGTRKIYGLCEKGYMPMSERVAKYLEKIIPLPI
ncbi:hypothetical protein CL619_04065 [archaeon]|nr:hypothetical protein [archaeon]|tara:strand:+ start:757 stop:1032 length:276 start_codon:yes stop_codon:yes gene_type:complete